MFHYNKLRYLRIKKTYFVLSVYILNVCVFVCMFVIIFKKDICKIKLFLQKIIYLNVLILRNLKKLYIYIMFIYKNNKIMKTYIALK